MKHKYAIEAGRCITRDGKPFVTINVCNQDETGRPAPAEADAFARVLPRLLEFVDMMAAMAGHKHSEAVSEYAEENAKALLEEMEEWSIHKIPPRLKH